MTDKPTDTNYAGRSQEERRAQRKGEKQPAQQQPGGPMAEEGREPDKNNSSGKLSDEGKKAWQTGSASTEGVKPEEPDIGPGSYRRENVEQWGLHDFATSIWSLQ